MPVLTLKVYILCKNNTTDLNFSQKATSALVDSEKFKNFCNRASFVGLLPW